MPFNQSFHIYSYTDKFILHTQDSISLYSEKLEKLKSIGLNNLNPSPFRFPSPDLGFNCKYFHDVNGTSGIYYSYNRNLVLLDPKTLDQVNSIFSSVSINSLSFNAFSLAVASDANSIHVFDTKTGAEKYVLLGGSLNPKALPKSYVPNPLHPGCSKVLMDEDRLIGVYGNLIRVYHFDLDQ
jgi:hypothetical protein